MADKLDEALLDRLLSQQQDANYEGAANFRERALVASREDAATLRNVAHQLGLDLNRQPRLDDAQALLQRCYTIVLQNIAYAGAQMQAAGAAGHPESFVKWQRWRAWWLPLKSQCELALKGELNGIGRN